MDIFIISCNVCCRTGAAAAAAQRAQRAQQPRNRSVVVHLTAATEKAIKILKCANTN